MNDEATEVKVGDGDWIVINAEATTENGRVNVRCNIGGTVSNYSVVIDPEGVNLFDEVRYPDTY